MTAESLDPGIYIVATPIGNLNDLTFRAADILKRADVIAAEDTRITGKLLKHIGSAVHMVSHHEHNAHIVRPELLARAQKEAVALVTDAGTPLISDPGYRLVRAARDAGVTVTSIPGACAAITALTLAGLPTDRFLFAGFAPPKEKGLRDVLAELGTVQATLVFYETGPRLARFLSAAADILGMREAAVTRELTKMYEEVVPGTLPALAAHYDAAGAPKGEIVVVIGPPLVIETSEADLDAALRAAMDTQTLKMAVKEVAATLGIARGTVYQRALELKAE
ncbi:16S rRNA (cytidine(1402)-2'-O)-methyltransferase [Pacificimonas sp. WHA3]|uniref:Ribosomal RNA small subunit methyltransferase I n=1 Tax=Pacificimonas pallii TaxID=2827236 RepID=A0ABS6SA55_9SPHN|nr:16S rRNA (cytidine(1402)-2'-O)-methyltransferase [Pacificimonas pallii]MBV7255263.1 16S rRNA (cytidine(1402)-2'-O)-methyltransferase [Pacificimonas pallii]